MIVKTPLRRLLFWAPRILCILLAILLSVFSLDVLGEGYGFWETILALLMHLIPTGIIVTVLVISWRWEWVGGVLFTVLAALYVITTWGRMHWSAYVMISGPLFLTGVLFLINWLCRGKPSRDHLS